MRPWPRRLSTSLEDGDDLLGEPLMLAAKILPRRGACDKSFHLAGGASPHLADGSDGLGWRGPIPAQRSERGVDREAARQGRTQKRGDFAGHTSRVGDFGRFRAGRSIIESDTCPNPKCAKNVRNLVDLSRQTALRCAWSERGETSGTSDPELLMNPAILLGLRILLALGLLGQARS